jgi:SPX domain protein involved in polyphosphate accumulation
MMSKKPWKELRQEVKYVIPADNHHRALNWIWHNDACFYKEYPDRQVNNIYFDSHNHDAYWDNLAGTSSRKKTRYRWYGLSLTPIAGALELKYKRNSFNWKWVYKINEVIFRKNASWHSIRRELTSHLPAELGHHLHENPMPVLINRYQRSYFRSRESDIRITLDTGLIFFKQGRILPNFVHKVSLLNKNILELKFPTHSKSNALELMSACPFPMSRCSKYITGVQAIAFTGI